MLEFKFPDIGEGITEGVILEWFVEVGQEVAEGEDLLLVETDKVNAEIPAPASGTIVERFGEIGETINVGDVLVVIGEVAERDKPTAGPKPEEEEKNAAVVGALESSAAVLEESRELEQPAASAGRKVLATPAARQLARELGIELTAIRGTGPEGGVRKEDVLLARETRAEETGPETAALSSLAKTMAENMSLSKREIPQAAVLDEFDLSELVRFRNDAKEKAEQEGIKLTYMPFLIKALVLALQDYPSFNARFSPETNEIVFQKDYNIGIAVDSPDGLVVPVIKNAEQLSLLRLAEEVQNLAEKARRRTLTLEEIRGGTFSLTNYGAVGALSGLPIIKHPEAAILGMGKISPKPIADGQGQIVVKQMLPLTLVFDHRFIDGGGAGRFMARLKELLEEPLLLLLS